MTAMHAYLLHSGDVAFVRQNLPALEKMLAYFSGGRRGLFVLERAGGFWYSTWSTERRQRVLQRVFL